MNMVFIPFQTLMSAIKILTTVARGTLLVQIPRDHSSALVSLDSPETGRTAEVKSLKHNLIYQKKFSVAVISFLRALMH